MSLNIRIGFGFDVHRFADDRQLWLGGINIPYEKGLLGHSDADVVIHALCDAILGAAALRDIGFHFPDNDPQYKGIDSKRLLREVTRLLGENGYMFRNADLTICAEAPKLNPYIPAMQQTLSDCIGCSAGDISIKATTTEKLRFKGRKEGISAYATVLIAKK